MIWLKRHQLKSGNVEARRKAAEELLRAPSPRAISALRLALKDEDAEVRRLAATALGKLEDERRVEPLLEALQDKDPGVLKAVVVALKRASDERLVPALVLLLRHGDAGVRGHTSQVLEAQGWRPTNKEEDIWFLVARGSFSRAAGFGVAALPALEAALSSASTSQGMAIVEALSQIGEARVVRALMLALKSTDPAVCIAAVEALTRIGDEQVIPPLLDLCSHANSQVRMATVEALGRLRAPTALETAQRMLRDSAWEVRRASAEALGRLGKVEAVEMLAQSLEDDDDDVREAVAMALGTLRVRESIGPLVRALKDTSSGVRRIAVAALTRIDAHWHNSIEARHAARDLRTALQSEDFGVRHFVSQLLASLGDLPADAMPTPAEAQASAGVGPSLKHRKLAVSLFMAILCDPDRDLRQAAAEALGRLKDTRARSPLTRAQADPDPTVRAAVQAALQALG